MSHTDPTAKDVARAAAQWLALLESGAVSEQQQRQLQRWRDSHALHEQAWQRAQLLRARFAGLPPSVAMASLDRPQASRRTLLKRGLAGLALLPAAYLLERQLPVQAWVADVRTGTGERRRVMLPDGSVLQLATASAVNLDPTTASLALIEGEIALKAAGEVPFTVRAAHGQIVLRGSEVCVRQFDAGCEVSVLNGTARVLSAAGAGSTLRVGQRLTLSSLGIGPVEAFDASQLSWRDGVLVAQNQPLGDLLREVRRWRPGVLRWDPALEALRVTGTFQLDDTDRILALLASSLALQVQATTRYWVTLAPRKKLA